MTVGGTGKTPLLIHLANDLKNQGRNPAILSRGYGQDEISLMREKCAGVPLAAGANRFAGAQELLKSNPVGVFLLDDGFQHWPLRRDLDIVLVDASAPFESGLLLPAGRLREPWNSLGRAQVAVLTRSHLVSRERKRELKRAIQELMPQGIVVAAEFQRKLIDAKSGGEIAWDSLQGKKVVAVSAIGNPQAFETELGLEGAVVFPLRFPDHHSYTKRDLNKIQKAVSISGGEIICTEKDWVKLKRWAAPMLFVRLDVRFSGEDEARWQRAVRGIAG